MISIRCLLPLFLLSSATANAGDILWRVDLQKTQEAAAASKSVVFIAVNMDGERANDRLVQETYADQTIQELSERTLNLVASNFEHGSSDKPCSRFKTVTCEEHRHVDGDVRSKILSPDARGFVVAPQHVFLGPDGKVILSVPYDLKTAELEWCFVHALRSVDPDLKIGLSSGARPPKRLMMGSVYSLESEEAAEQQAPLTREAALELIKDLKKGKFKGGDLVSAVRRLAMADEPEAREYCLQQLRKVPGRSGGKLGGGAQHKDVRPTHLHWIGAHSPSSYWEVMVEFIDDNDPEMRAEAIVALEQLGDKHSLKALVARLRKEKEERLQKNILRAIGTCAADDKTARKTLLKQAKSKREPLLQINAILALGWLSKHKDIDEFLLESLEAEVEDTRRAAVLAMALTRDQAWHEILKGELAKSPTPVYQETLEKGIALLEGGPTSGLRTVVEELASDEIERERIFGPSDKKRRGAGTRDQDSKGDTPRGVH